MSERPDGRAPNEMRDVKITRKYTKYAEGSCLIEFGDTKVICTASIEERVPQFLRGQGQGWVSAEYGMLPRSCKQRIQRETTKPSGRHQEIQRLVGRSLRSIVDLKGFGERTVWIDCDVIQADGGTRTASITGSFVATSTRSTRCARGISSRGCRSSSRSRPSAWASSDPKSGST